QVHGAALDLFRHGGVGVGGVGQGDHLTVLGQRHDDVGVVVKLGNVALHALGHDDAQQVGAAPVVELAALGQGQRDLVARRDLLDGRGVGLQLDGDAGQTHTVVAPGKDLVVLVDGDHVVQTRRDHGQFAHFGAGRDLFELIG